MGGSPSKPKDMAAVLISAQLAIASCPLLTDSFRQNIMGGGHYEPKDMAAQLAAILRVHGEKGWDEWSQIQGNLAHIAAIAAHGRGDPIAAFDDLLDLANEAWSSHDLMRLLEEAHPDMLKHFVLRVAYELNMTPLCDSEAVQMVDVHGNFCEENIYGIINCSAELSAPNAPYSVVSIVGGQCSGKSYLMNCLFGTRFPKMDAKLGSYGGKRGIKMSRCIWPSLLLLDFEGFDGRYRAQDMLFEKQTVRFALTVSDIMMVNISIHDIGQEEGPSTQLFRLISQERRELPKAYLTKILVVLRHVDEEVPLESLRRDVLRSMGEIWGSVNEESMKFEDYIEVVNIIGLPDKSSVQFPKEVTVLRKLLSNNISAKVPASSVLASWRISWDTIKKNLELDEVRKMRGDDPAFKLMASQLAAMLLVQGEKGRDDWSQLHWKLSEVAAMAGDDPTTAGQALLKVAKDASSTRALMRTLEGRVSKANPSLIKHLVLLVADELSMTPLCDSEPVLMVNEDHDFCGGNVDGIIKSSSELSAPNAPYAVVSIIGGRSSGKSYLLNRLFGTKFPEMNPGHGRSIGIMMSRCIGPSLLLLDFEGFRTGTKGQNTKFQKQATLFAMTVSDLVIVNMSSFDIGQAEGYATLLFRIMFQERTKLPQGVTKILVVVRHYDGEPPFETLRSNVKKLLEKIWESVVGYVKFKDYIEVNIVGLPKKNSSEFPKEVTLLRKLLSNIRSAKVPSSVFLIRSSILWDTIREDKELDINQLYPGESIFPSKSIITSRISSGLDEARISTHSNNYLSATVPRAMTFSELQCMTNGFSKKGLIGKGGFGNVYKGVLDNREVIAIKKLKNCPELVEESFRNELLNLMRVQHRNIIRLIGYCSETRDKVVEHEGRLVIAGEQERALCLEYMEGGTLEDLLSDESCGLDWDDRYKIIKGICHGLKYLHTGFKDPIYHLDLKPANILLDGDRIPKIGDFGLSTLLDAAGTFVAKTFAGTKGYMPPEYIDRRQVSPKFDVFSLGVIILEVLAGRDAYNNYKSEFMTSEEFLDRVRKKNKQVTRNWRKREQAKPLSTEELLELHKCIKLALRCVEDDRANRPTITEVVEELNTIDVRDETDIAALSI